MASSGPGGDASLQPTTCRTKSDSRKGWGKALNAIRFAGRVSRGHKPRSKRISQAAMDMERESRVLSASCAFSIELGELLGEGTSGKAFLVNNEHDGQHYCLKVVAIGPEDGSKRMYATNEAHLHGSLNHVGIVRYCYSWSTPTPDGGLVCYTMMELCQHDLWSCVEEATDTGIDRAIRLQWSKQISGALAHIHDQGIQHRDLNPWNVFVTAAMQAKIGDFGLSVNLPVSNTLSGWQAEGAEPLDESAIGSLYSAPELGSESYGLAADIFSLGMTLVFIWSTAANSLDDTIDLAEGLHELGPEKVDGLSALGEQAACPFMSLILSMVSHDPAMRPSAAEAHAAIDAALRSD